MIIQGSTGSPTKDKTKKGVGSKKGGKGREGQSNQTRPAFGDVQEKKKKRGLGGGALNYLKGEKALRRQSAQNSEAKNGGTSWNLREKKKNRTTRKRERSPSLRKVYRNSLPRRSYG